MTQKPKHPDLNQLATSIVVRATGEEDAKKIPEKDPAAVALGRKGGLKGGKARAASLSAIQRRKIAKKAALARWDKQKENKDE